MIPVIPMESLTQWINAQVTDASNTLKNLATLGLMIVILVVGIKNKLAFGKILAVMIAGGLIMWAAFYGGMEMLAKLFQAQG